MKHEQAARFEEAVPRRRHAAPWLARTVRSEWLAGGLIVYFGISQLLLWRFLNFAPAIAYAAGVAVIALLCWGMARGDGRHAERDGPTVATILVCIAASAALLLLGGEGRVFYANIDWQVRDAVLRDMSLNPWPFAYTARSHLDLLRAPLGMYFVPSLAFKLWGARAADWALLAQNSLLLGTLMAFASKLFSSTRHRLIALAVLLAFSGLDVLGAALTHRWSEHLDSWSGAEFSSMLSLAFWVPHHAIAGWAGAVCYLLWEKRKLPLRMLLTLLPLSAIWSPLALIGSMPFALAAAGTALIRRELRAADLLLAAGAVLLSLPALFYLSAGASSVGAGLSDMSPAQFVVFQVIETLPYLLPLAAIALRERKYRVTLGVAAACLLIAPVLRIGSSFDFTSRASIPALAVTAILTARVFSLPKEAGVRLTKIWLTAVLCIAAITGAAEVARALEHPPSPLGTCSFFKAWDQSFSKFPKDSYLAPVAQVPSWLRPKALAPVSATDPARCWPRPWYHPH